VVQAVKACGQVELELHSVLTPVRDVCERSSGSYGHTAFSFFLGGLPLNLLNRSLCGLQSPSESFRKDSTLTFLLGIER
jgi:hypothetical protein